MIDAHVHIERGPYTKEWISKFVDKAVDNNITELYLLEHSHRFFEFRDLYKEICSYSQYQMDWFTRRNNLSLIEYLKLIDACRKEQYPISVKWGLEICYVQGKEEVIRNVLNCKDFDFLTGSIHWIDSWGFDHKVEYWEDKNVNEIHLRYYELMIELVKSNLFDHLAHPDSIKCFNRYPTIDMTDRYVNLAEKIKQYGIKAEISGGLHLNYNHQELGINKYLFEIMRSRNIDFITASDAHSQENVGKFIKECEAIVSGR
jgi:histidinol-phosphatase (PHP family)